MASKVATPKKLNLALQGGGAHGAFTWGVLDRILEDDRIELEGISGTSAGAMNAAVAAQGMVDGGRGGARAALEEFWMRIAEFAYFSPFQRSILDRLLGNWNLDGSPAIQVMDVFQRLLSPYQFNPMNNDPLRSVLAGTIKEATLRRCDLLKLFISATNVHTGKIKVFSASELSLDVLLASACLPMLYQAVEIEGVPYWDGGYMGNPAIFPLIYGCESPDVAVVQINPLTRTGTPRTMAAILDRLNEITFNSSLIQEMRAVAFVQKLIDSESLVGPESQRLKRMHIHWISAEADMAALGVSTKMNVERAFLLYLRDIGRAAAELWLEINFDAIGERSSIDIQEQFL
jgi:NTE family protein